MEAAHTLRLKENVICWESCLIDVKHRHSAMLDILLDSNKKWKKLNDDQDRAYGERRHSDVARYEVTIRSVNIEHRRLEKQLDNIHKEIDKVKSEIIKARTTLLRASSHLKSTTIRSSIKVR